MDAPIINRPPQQLTKAIIYILLSAFSNAAMITAVKFAQQKVPPEISIFARNLITVFIILSLSMLKRQPIFHNLATKRWLLHGVRLVFGLYAMGSYFVVINYIPLGQATLFYYTAPLFVPLITCFWLKIMIINRLWIGLLIGFIGLITVLQPHGTHFNPYMLLALSSGIAFAIVIVTVRLLSYTEPASRTVFYFALFSTLLAFLFTLSLPAQTWASLKNPTVLFFLVLVGVFGYLYQILLTLASKHAPVRLTSSFLYSSVVFSSLFDWLFWGKLISLTTIIGFILIVLGTVLVLYLYPEQDYKKVENNNSIGCW